MKFIIVYWPKQAKGKRRWIRFPNSPVFTARASALLKIEYLYRNVYFDQTDFFDVKEHKGA